ncbi:hypothetical protein AO391_03450 [Pseudomonas marginalis ICMP 9505]|uniref:Uncharacterized protein n=1 Tax=Pseudomonas kitaguniensis TaxID=2607908 RepID=A0A5N7JYL0_9PSED|nr:hypothetical protein [Pseudomonas kitaguniensis]KTC23087.1 hypothetical protein AO391_03450 [Pseudomonas marginalis ICMP 9505]MPQ86434.1 hypothetical protein [Pseudomonas kitaguniensis]MPR01225.1 hypothetical protein [Pseudomonas kitaguniensis]RMP66780.1 hypothetical protein ALQ18_00441 [Pseudomonas marginalis pv. marginalis]
MQNKVDVAVMIGSGVPQALRALGQKACWVVLLNGEQRGTAFASRGEAEECRTAWESMMQLEQPASLH